MALPIPDKSLDAAAMALVIFFVPHPATGIAEMNRPARRPGRCLCLGLSRWRLPLGTGACRTARRSACRPSPRPVPRRPGSKTSRLWRESGLERVESRVITIERTFADFDEFWTTALLAPTMAYIRSRRSIRRFSPTSKNACAARCGLKTAR